MSEPPAFHVELRQFPHNLCRFNLSEQQVLAGIVLPWAHEQWIELGERKWSPHQAKLTVLEGPTLPVQQLSMGRGWRSAQRQGKDVTERLLDAARHVDVPGVRSQLDAAAVEPVLAGSAVPAAAAESAAAGDAQLRADALGLELLKALGSEAAPLRRAWELADARYPGLSPSASLALAERAVRSLLEAGLLVLGRGEEAAAELPAPAGADADRIPRTIGSWTGEDAGLLAWMRRS